MLLLVLAAESQFDANGIDISSVGKVFYCCGSPKAARTIRADSDRHSGFSQ